MEDTLAQNYTLTESECKPVCELYFDDSWIFAMLCPASLHNIFKDEIVQKVTKNKTETCHAQYPCIVIYCQLLLEEWENLRSGFKCQFLQFSLNINLALPRDE